MKTPFRFRLSAVLLAAGLALGFAACGQKDAPAPSSAGGGLTVTDMAGREVSFSEPPKKIIALQASDVEILYALGAEDKLSGVGEYCNYPPEAMEKATVPSGANTNIEQIVSLWPDVLIMGVMAQPEGQVAQLEKAGIKVVQTNAQDINGTYEAIALLGKLSGREAEAQKLTEEMKTAFSELKAKAGDGSKRVYFEISPLEYGLWTAGNNTFMQEICDLIGVKNCFDDVTGWAEISEEQVIQRNPDYIATVAMYTGDGPTPAEEILARSGWRQITAVAQNRIYQADNDMLTRPGPRLVQGALELYDFIYGEQ